MTESAPARRYRFGAFEADASTGELRRQGIRIKLNAQPFQVLLMLLEHPGEVLTREEISRALWSDGTFVDYDHGVNSAVNRIREALGDAANSPRFVETLARRGYRFVAPVESIADEADLRPLPSAPSEPPQRSREFESRLGDGILSSPEELPRTSHAVVQTLFLLLQLMYLGFYVGALTNLAEIDDLLSPLPRASLIGARLHSVCGALSRTWRSWQIPEDVARAPHCRRGVGALAFSADAPHQCRTGAGLYGPAGLLAVCTARANADGRGLGQKRTVNRDSLNQTNFPSRFSAGNLYN
jgi:DNA-binding winged helix-turn-helix (wHTH) protein